jgi:hypothetical protein
MGWVKEYFLWGGMSGKAWEALGSMTDEEIDYSEIPSLLDSFLEIASVWRPKSTVSTTEERCSDF